MGDYLFVVDTEQYAGNFERSMVAWITGHTGDCGVGKGDARRAREELPADVQGWFEDHVMSEPDEQGCHRPAAIWPTPGWFNNGLGGHFRDEAPEREVLAHYNDEVDKHAAHTEKVYADKDYAKKEAQRFRADHLNQPGHFPAYLSVVCFLDEQPPAAILDLMKERARTFKSSHSWDTPITITGFRRVHYSPDRERKHPMPIAPVSVDAAFPLRGTTLPLDHGYPLFAAVSRLIPVHARAHWGIHPVFGERTAPGVLSLNDRSWLKLRVPATELAEILPLAGQAIEVAGHRVTVGVPQLFPLVSAATLKARFVNVKKFQEPVAFVDALRRQLATMELGQDPERVRVFVPTQQVDGKEEPLRRIMLIAGKKVVGFAVQLEGLEASASLAVQRQGLGGRRHMGGGIFVPPGRRG
jgi:CRISPR-associated protein Cas6